MFLMPFNEGDSARRYPLFLGTCLFKTMEQEVLFIMYLLLGNILDLSSGKNRDNSKYCSENTQGKHTACHRHNFGKVIDEKLNEEFSLPTGERKNICRGDWESMLCAVVTSRHRCEANTHLGKSSTRKKRVE